MFGRPTGSLAITVALAVVATAGAIAGASLMASPRDPVGTRVQASLVPAEPDHAATRFLAGRDAEPEFTGSVVLPLRRGE